MILFWTFGIPFVAFIQMRNNRDILDTVGMKERLGFIFNGYKKDKYWWEIFGMFRKIIIIIIIIFFASFGS